MRLSGGDRQQRLDGNECGDAFIVHAEGNEPEVDTSEIMGGLALAFAYYSGSEDMCRSMLEDKAPYGIEGRENVTDDLTLHIIDRVTVEDIVNMIISSGVF